MQGLPVYIVVSLLLGAGLTEGSRVKEFTMKQLSAIESAISEVDVSIPGLPRTGFSLEEDGGMCDKIVASCRKSESNFVIYGPKEKDGMSPGVSICHWRCEGGWKFDGSNFDYETTLAMIGCVAKQFPATAEPVVG